MTTPVVAMCLAVPETGGTAKSTSLLGHHPQKAQCKFCLKQYSIDYDPTDTEMIDDFAQRLLAVGQKLVNESHPTHPAFLRIHAIS